MDTAVEFYVRAAWDPEAAVWISDSDIPGFVIEAGALAESHALTRHFAPALLRENLAAHDVVVADAFSDGHRLSVNCHRG